MRNFLSLLITLFAAAPSFAEMPALPRAAEILNQTERVADWQIGHLVSIDYVGSYREDTVNPTGWVQGTLFAGLSALADRTGETRYSQAILDHDRRTDWSLSGGAEHADNQLIGQTYFWDYRRSHDPHALSAILHRFDEVLAEHLDGSLDFSDGGKSCQKRWCWSDALFMAPATWATASRITGDPRYLSYADQEVQATVQKLYDAEAHLFYRDSRFIGQRDAEGHKIFWSRGNGWVLAGLARFLAELPADHPSRGRYESLFKDMAQRVIQLQGSNGTWPSSLLSGAKSAGPETSGTALFLFGLAWGVNHGLLDQTATLPVLVRGWSALTAAIQPDGRLGWVQQIGYAPDQVSASDTQLYGTGALLLAGVELARLADREIRDTDLHIRNPIALDRPDSVIRLDLADMPARPAAWEVTAAGMPVPSQIIGGEMVLLLNLGPNEERTVRLHPLPDGPAPRVIARTQADLAIRAGATEGHDEKGRVTFSGGEFQTVGSFTPSADHWEHDGILAHEGPGWESDRAAYRLYLDQRAVTDLFAKKRPELVMHNVGRAADYHVMADWGMDILHVGESLGAGAIGVLRNGVATQIGPNKAITATGIADGPVIAGFEVKTFQWMFDGKASDLTARYTIAAGSRLTEVVAQAEAGLPMVAGIVKHEKTDILRPRGANGRSWSYFATWGRQSLAGDDDLLGLAFFYPVADVVRTGDDGKSLYVLYADSSKPIRFLAGAAWRQELGGITGKAQFQRYLEETAEALSHPAVICPHGTAPCPSPE